MSILNTFLNYSNTAGTPYDGALVLLSGAVALAISGGIYCIVSKLYLHPLAKFPGPPLAAMTDYYVAYYDIVKGGGLVEQLVKLHEQYGPIVRFGPDKLHFSDLSAYEAIYRDNRFLKDARFYEPFMSATSSFGQSDIHAAKKRGNIIRPFFSKRSILQFEHIIQETIDRFVVSLSKKFEAHEVVNIYHGFLSVTMEVVTAYCYGESYHAIEDPNYSLPIVLALKSTNFLVFVMQHFRFLEPLLLGMPAWIENMLPDATTAFKQLMTKLDEQISGIMNDPAKVQASEHRTIFHHMLNPKEGGKQLDHRELRDEGTLLLAAGTDTTANTCNLATFYILSNAEIQKKLKEELKEAWPNADEHISLEKLEKLPYLTAIINESLRLSHGIVSPLPRIVTEATEIAGHMVPENTVVSMSQTFVHLNPDIFPEPHVFNPERWFKEGSEDLYKSIVAFSKGPRMCIGINLAWAEAYLILANVFRKIDMHMVNTTKEDIKWAALLTPVFQGIVQVKIDGVKGVPES
ncbi:hypothetical protein D9611_010489 [Ephemerocybe angulata]|uniref:Cytochrome P450 n=1 Tax=Ephemerocybe angulata TaxID=980116 RepID=A0A8H5BUT0_9AGAR|nr:hypothetical protein D9611_010489 [Tulosesus angulatus]